MNQAESVPRAVASVAPSVGPLIEPRSLPLAVLTRGRPQALVNELLNAFPLVGFAGVDVTLRIYGDAAHGVKLTRHAPAHPEARHDLKRIAPQDEDLFVVTVGDIKESLLRIVRKRDIPHRPV